MKHGLVLTHAPTIQYLRNTVFAGKYNALKIVTHWGLATSWNQVNRVAVAGIAPTLVIRTFQGDGLGSSPWPNWEQVLEQVRPWYIAAAPHIEILIEIGNEPNLNPDLNPSGYAWHLLLAIQACRGAFPRAKIISTALSPSNTTSFRDWIQNPDFARAIDLCDYIGVHQYAFHNLATDDTKHRKLNELIQTKKKFALTEMGINDPQTAAREKVKAYKRYATRQITTKYAMAFDYHLCALPIDEDQSNYSLRLMDYSNAEPV